MSSTDITAGSTTTDDPNAPEHHENPSPWVSHPIDIRLSVPFVRTRFYLTVVAGRERRPGHRRRSERLHFPILTFANALFALGMMTLFTLTGLVILIAHSAIIEY